MQILKLIQGSPEWHSFRQTHFGASEAASMLGLSKQLSRNDLLLYKSTGKSKEYSDWVQKNILDYGHEIEAKARELFEKEIDDDLYTVTCSEDFLSASCDGLTMDGSIAFEHKQYNKELVDFIDTNERLPDTHMPQCQQILMVTRAKKVIFVCSDGTENNRSIIEIFPDQSWFDRIRAGWNQFKIDLANFQPKELAEKPEPEAIMQLPTLSIQIKGEVTVSNLPQFKEAAETFISNIKTDLKTDEDFVQAEATVKFCGDTEARLDAAKAQAIGQTASIDELMRTIDHIKESIRQKRLTLEKSVKSQKESIKTSIMGDGFKLCMQHVMQLEVELKPIIFQKLADDVVTRQRFEAACKNKRTLASLHNAVDTEVAAIKIKLDELAGIVRRNLRHLPEDLSLFRDLQSIITKPEDDFKLLVESRLAEQKRKQEEAEQRAIAAAQEHIRLEKEAETKRIEQEEKSKQAAAAERERLAKENEEKRIQEAKESEAKRLEQEAKVKASMEAYNAEVKRKEEEARAADQGHKKKILNEVYVSLTKHGMSHADAELLMAAISRNEIQHVTINF